MGHVTVEGPHIGGDIRHIVIHPNEVVVYGVHINNDLVEVLVKQSGVVHVEGGTPQQEQGGRDNNDVSNTEVAMALVKVNLGGATQPLDNLDNGPPGILSPGGHTGVSHIDL
jgi:hypothetical protein